jgi:hypothetical protein
MEEMLATDRSISNDDLALRIRSHADMRML